MKTFLTICFMFPVVLPVLLITAIYDWLNNGYCVNILFLYGNSIIHKN